MGNAILFADSLVSSRPELARRGWSTLTSFAMQAVVATALLILPIFRPTGSPLLHHISTPVSLGSPLHEGPAVSPHRGNVMAAARPAMVVFRAPSYIPSTLPSTGDDSAWCNPGSGGRCVYSRHWRDWKSRRSFGLVYRGYATGLAGCAAKTSASTSAAVAYR